LAIVLPIPLRYTDYDYPYGIFKLFFERSKQKRTFKDSQKKANEKTDYSQQNTSLKTNDGTRSSRVDAGAPEWQAVPAPLVA
jgi:hypothetical protein